MDYTLPPEYYVTPAAQEEIMQNKQRPAFEMQQNQNTSPAFHTGQNLTPEQMQHNMMMYQRYMEDPNTHPAVKNILRDLLMGSQKKRMGGP